MIHSVDSGVRQELRSPCATLQFPARDADNVIDATTFIVLRAAWMLRYRQTGRFVDIAGEIDIQIALQGLRLTILRFQPELYVRVHVIAENEVIGRYLPGVAGTHFPQVIVIRECNCGRHPHDQCRNNGGKAHNCPLHL